MEIGRHRAIGERVGHAVADGKDPVVAFIGEDRAVRPGSGEVELIGLPLLIVAVVEVFEIDAEQIGKGETAEEGQENGRREFFPDINGNESGGNENDDSGAKNAFGEEML